MLRTNSEYHKFLALLEYVSRAHEIGICPSSIRRLSMSELFLNFLPNSPHKTAFGIFDILKIKILMNMGPNGSANFKTLLLQIAAKSFETCPEFSSQWSSQNNFWDF